MSRKRNNRKPGHDADGTKRTQQIWLDKDSNKPAPKKKAKGAISIRKDWF